MHRSSNRACTFIHHQWTRLSGTEVGNFHSMWKKQEHCQVGYPLRQCEPNRPRKIPPPVCDAGDVESVHIWGKSFPLARFECCKLARRIAPKVPRCCPIQPKVHNFMSNQTVFVLGAGFSCLAGIPLMNELRDEVLSDPRIQNLPALARHDKQRSLEEILLEFRQRATHDALLNVSLCLLWKKHQMMPDLPEAYSRFARVAAESAGIVSLNWDLVCELALYTADMKWSYSTDRGTPIVKPHGSINWTNHPQLARQKWKSGNGFAQVDDERCISYRPVDPFRDPLLGYTDSDFKYVTFPSLLHDNSKATDRLWAEACALIAKALRVVFIGYSLPCYDTRARSEFQTACSGKEVTVIDPSEQALETYQNHFGKGVAGRLGKFDRCDL
jgi:hypothetical protein